MLHCLNVRGWNRIAGGKLPRQAPVQFPDYVISGLFDRRQSAPILSTENGFNNITSNTQRQSKKSTTDSKDAATDQQQCRPPVDINAAT
jgi:hypothetical protein